MPIHMTCPSCGKTLAAPDSAAGKRAKCPGCAQPMQVPAAVGSEDVFAVANDPPPATAASSFGAVSAPASSAAPAGGDARRPCPDCGEMIVATAAKCRFCGAIFDSRLKQVMPASGDPDLKRLAQFQRGIIFSVLGQIIGLVASGAGGGMQMPILQLFGGLILLAAGVSGLIFVVLTAAKVYSTVAAVFLAVLMFVPCVSLIVLLSINSAATSRLQLNGIKVGFFGANMSQF